MSSPSFILFQNVNVNILIYFILPLYSSGINLFFENEMLTLAIKTKKDIAGKHRKEHFWQCPSSQKGLVSQAEKSFNVS